MAQPVNFASLRFRQRPEPAYMAAARTLGKAMAEAGIGLVYGGGGLGPDAAKVARRAGTAAT